MIIEYVPIGVLLIISSILAVVLCGASYLLASQNPDPEKLSAYECGFDPYEDARNSFDVRFYLVAILFIIFDLEAMFFFPWSVTLSFTGSSGFWVMVDFVLELIIGYNYAWQIGALDWE
jgi:NADH:ubiquinone oxidoreductase subunit 3 (subunit A)